MEERKTLFTKLENGEDKVKNDGSQINYLILLEGIAKYDDGFVYRDWLFIKGRQEAYDYIVDFLLQEGDESVDCILNINKSLIYAENPNIDDSANKLKLSNGLSLYTFIKDITILNKVDPREGFDIDDYKQIEPEEVYGTDEEVPEEE